MHEALSLILVPRQYLDAMTYFNPDSMSGDNLK